MLNLCTLSSVLSLWVCARVCPHPVGEAVSGEDGPGLPVHVMAIGLVHVLSQAVNVGGWELGGQL